MRSRQAFEALIIGMLTGFECATLLVYFLTEKCVR